MIFPSSSNAKIFLVIRRNCFYIKVCMLRVCLILQKTVLLCNRQSRAVACAPGLLPPSCQHVPEILSHTLMTKSELKSQSHFEQTFYLDHYSWFLNLFRKNPTMFVMATWINWVELCWGATGDTGTVVKLGQFQTLQPWLPDFLCEKHIL